MSKIDWERFEKGSEQIEVFGVVDSGERAAMIEEAIARIQENPASALRAGYLGFKNYAHFGDQRCDCEYGYGPNHGSIVFSIGRHDQWHDKPLTDDAIYLLMCFRDAKNTRISYYSDRYGHEVQGNIQQAFVELENLKGRADKIEKELSAILVEENN